MHFSERTFSRSDIFRNELYPSGIGGCGLRFVGNVFPKLKIPAQLYLPLIPMSNVVYIFIRNLTVFMVHFFDIGRRGKFLG